MAKSIDITCPNPDCKCTIRLTRGSDNTLNAEHVTVTAPPADADIDLENLFDDDDEDEAAAASN